jgi:hypothetical protein
VQSVKEMVISNLIFVKDNKNQKVIIYDKNKTILFSLDMVSFKVALKDKLDLIEKQEGVVKIEGENPVDLYLMNDNKKIFIFLSDRKSTKSILRTFLQNC